MTSQDAPPSLCFQDIVCSADGNRLGQLLDQKVTVYVQQGATNGNFSDGWRMIALSKQLQIQVISAPSFQDCNEHNEFVICFLFFVCDLSNCKLHKKYPTKNYFSLDQILEVLQHVQTNKNVSQNNFLAPQKRLFSESTLDNIQSVTL